MSWASRRISRLASSYVETQSRVKFVRRLSARRSRVRMKSSSSSSTRRIRTARESRSVLTVDWQLHDLDPIAFDLFHQRDERLELHRLGDERVRAEVVG